VRTVTRTGFMIDASPGLQAQASHNVLGI
jgi:hypothetical protein